MGKEGKEIRTEPDYLSQFSPRDPGSAKQTALDVALDVRKFEIDLYWKRATYFWTLIGAAFAGFFLLRSKDAGNYRLLLVSCIGFLLSLGWYLVNRGSKYWQENWERHVDLLESRDVGPLFKTTISREEFPFIKFWKGYPYSVTKINQLISLFVVLIWLGLITWAFPALPMRDRILWWAPRLMVAVTALFSILLFWLGGGGSDGKPRRINFRESALQSTKSEKVPMKEAPARASTER
jgi:hypothetical protein